MQGMLKAVQNALGLALLMAALVCTGCGDDSNQTATCSPASCAGCCQNGICVGGEITSACGAEGAICITCPVGTTCQEGQCRQENEGCTGCLSATGNCLPGMTVDACGAGGVSCTPCSGTQTCSAGTCQNSCSYLTCAAGCCQAGVCIDPPTQLSCGLNGTACKQCSSNQTCESGQCATEVADCASDCPGCCQDNKCLAGDTKSACGVGGDPCQPCGETQACHEGTCVELPEPCGPDTCEGCCTAEGCVVFDDQDLEACGKDGVACNSCGTAALSCTQGTCVEDQPCFAYCQDGCCTLQGQCIGFNDQSGTQCGDNGGLCAGCDSNLSCLEGGCVTDPVYDVLILSAVIADKNSEGEDWDSWIGNPLPDPFARVGLDETVLHTTDTDTIDNTLTPNWATVKNKVGSWTASQLTGIGLHIAVIDDDTGPINEMLGTCQFKPTAVPTTDQTLAACGDHVTNLKIRFVLQ